MFIGPPREREWISWLWVALWSLVIFVTIPFARAIQEFVALHWGRGWFTDAALASAVLATGGTILHVLRRDRRLEWRHLWLAGVGGVFGLWTYRMTDTPEVAMHFVQYGVLGLLLFRALVHRTRDPAIYAAAVLAGALIGTADEMVQWLTPRRFFDYADVRVNTWAVALVQIGIAMGVRPPVVSRPVHPGSIRRVCRFGMAWLVLIGLCLSNTPRVAVWLGARVPALAYLAEKDSVMSEYGFRHVDPEIGVVFSRFSLDDLRRTDRERAVEAARILDEYRDPEDYAAFLKLYTPVTDPFLHEARVHLNRRDHYWSVAWKHRADAEVYRRHCTVAYRENQILEKYFGETLRRSRERFTPEEVASLAAHLETDRVYGSGVSADLITRFSLRQAWAGIALGVVVLGLIPRILSAKARR